MTIEIITLPGTYDVERVHTAMTHLVETIARLKLDGKVELGGRWVRLEGEHCPVYIVEDPFGASYFVWCGAPCDRTVKRYRDAREAINAGLERAKQVENR
jgi:hypothetical protein